MCANPEPPEAFGQGRQRRGFEQQDNGEDSTEERNDGGGSHVPRGDMPLSSMTTGSSYSDTARYLGPTPRVCAGPGTNLV
jgi:hypothetical protein